MANVIPAVFETDIYTNSDGEIVIRQVHPNDEDAVVIIPIEYAARVINAIKKLTVE